MDDVDLMSRLEEAQALLADGFEDALIGITENHHFRDVAVYDYDDAVDILMVRDGMSEEEAIEFMEYNVVSAYVGESTPVFIRLISSYKQKQSALSLN